jgi:MFS family permease
MGLVYIVGAIVNIATFLLVPRYLRKRGNFRLITMLTALELSVLLGIACIPWNFMIILLFIIQQGIGPIIFYCLDIFLEQSTEANYVGSVRGMYLTMYNLSPIITPVIVGLVLATSADYWKVYLMSALFLIPFLLIILINFWKFKDPEYPKIDIHKTVSHFLNSKNVYDVFIDQFLLSFFYCWMVIYMPIYLMKNIGFGWEEIGIILSIALLPFIIFQIPIGKMEDRKHDEKMLLIYGFLIMSASVALMPFITEKSLVFWATILFISRIGASIVEVSTETYFFKHVKSTNAGYISLFRMTKNMAFLIVSAIAGFSIYIMGIGYSWIILALIMLVGVRYARKLN